jgi:O-antigen/teichoic acid export membrane protein
MWQALKNFAATSPLTRRVLNKWRSSRLMRSVATMAGGTVVAQGLSLLCAPITTRLYSPSDYGIAAVFNSTLGTLLLAATCRYEMALMLPQNEEDARSVLWCCLALGCFASLASGIAALCLGRWLFALLGAPELYRYWWMVPLALLGGSLYQCFSVWALRRKAYMALSGTKVSQAMTGYTVSIVVGAIWKGPIGLLLGSFCSMSMGVGRLCRGSFWRERTAAPGAVVRRIAKVLHSYGRFAFLTTGATLLSSAGTLLAPLLFSTHYPQSIVGHFSLAQRVISVPGSLIGMAVGQVFIAEAAEILRERPAEMPHFFKKVTRKLAPVVLGLLLMGALCPWAFPLAFGARWKTAGVFAAMLSVLAAVQIVVAPIGDISVLRQRQGIQIGLGLLRTLVVIGSICIPAHFGLGPMFAVGTYTLGMSLVSVIAYFFYERMARHVPLPAAAAPLTVAA